MTSTGGPNVSVVIVTYERAAYLEQCLVQLALQTRPPFEVLVVDASHSSASRLVVSGHSDVRYLQNPAGRGSMTNSRNLGWRSAQGDIVAYIDDDAFAERTWLARLAETYTDASIGGVGGRAVRSEFDIVPDAGMIGALGNNGELVGNFDAPKERGIDVMHLIGCNMSFRRSVLEQIGGFDETYPGTEVREETDVCFRVLEAGYRLWYQPDATVVHVGGPYVRGHRFDTRYDYYAARNHMQLLVRHYGPSAPLVRRYASTALRRVPRDAVRRVGGSIARATAVCAGLAAGFIAGTRTNGAPRPTNRELVEAPSQNAPAP